MFETKWLFLVIATILATSVGQNFNFHSTSQDTDDFGSGQRLGKNLLDWVGLGTGPHEDPYKARTNSACLQGDLAECFKSHALNSFEEFFSKERYDLTENARVVRMPVEQLRSIAQEPYEYSSEPRADDSEWDHLVKFAMRKVEKFLKSTALEVKFSDEVTEHGRYSPRFVDEIADEIDIIEDKKDTLFSRKRLRKLFIPFLIVLKLFKLKLLLFLPLILGLASFKKLLTFLAIIIPGLIGFFKLCKPDLGQNTYFGNVPQYSINGLGHLNSQHLYKPQYNPAYNNYGHGGYHGQSNGVAFREDPGQHLAYSGYSEYRSAKTDVSAVGVPETSSKKSILPDS